MTSGGAMGFGDVPWSGVYVAAALALGITMWLVWIRSREPAARVRPVPGAAADRDLVSVAVAAVASDRLVPFLLLVRQRLNAVCVASTGWTLERLPSLTSHRRDRTLRTRRFRRLRRGLFSLERRARWAESPWRPRWDPWRRPVESRAALWAATGAFLTVLDRESEESPHR